MFSIYYKMCIRDSTNSGSTKSRLTLIKNRVEEQQTTIEELKSTNEDKMCIRDRYIRAMAGFSGVWQGSDEFNESEPYHPKERAFSDQMQYGLF